MFIATTSAFGFGLLGGNSYGGGYPGKILKKIVIEAEIMRWKKLKKWSKDAEKV